MRVIHDYQGAPIRLTDERLAHILEHPEMVGLESAIEQTLARPETVIESFSDPQARLYYRFYVGTRVGDKYLCVVVKISRDDAFVLTAYLTDRVKRGAQIWPQEK
jgi:molybdopterin synthase catalytic subunit